MAGALTTALAGLVFVLTYAALTVPALPRRGHRVLAAAGVPGVARAGEWLLARPGIAVLGAVLMVAVGAVGPAEAVAAVDAGTLVLLLGMMTLVAGLELAGAFTLLARALVRAFPGPRRLLAAVMVATAVLAALVLNDAIVLLFTPVLVKACRERGWSPFPFLAGEAAAANVGSVATPVGNPQNAFIAVTAGLSFPEFAAALVLPALVALALAVAFTLLWFRRDLATAAPAPTAPDAGGPVHRRLMLVAVGATALALALFALGDRVPLALPWKAALAGGALVALAWPVAGASPVQLLARVDWGILAFFVGLFVLVEGIAAAGLLAALQANLGVLGLATLPGLAVVTTLLSNAVSNVPAVVLLAPVVASIGDPDLWLVLAASSTLAGNATFLGSAATVIVAESARAHGSDFDAWRFTRYGFPLALVTLVAGLATLAAT